jgi:hypothetical protein
MGQRRTGCLDCGDIQANWRALKAWVGGGWKVSACCGCGRHGAGRGGGGGMRGGGVPGA